MMTNEQEKNKALIERFPFLLPWYGRDDDGRIADDYDYETTMLDRIPSGWRVAFGEEMCEEILAALLSSGNTREDGLAALKEYYISDIKEKYGQLRWLDSGGVDEVIRKYEKLAERTCISCGKPATRLSTHWISPYCDQCGPEYERYVGIEE
jgi:hypothetical protein